MHPLFIFGFVLHATALAVIGFFVLFAADRATGRPGESANGWGAGCSCWRRSCCSAASSHSPPDGYRAMAGWVGGTTG